MSQSLMIVDDDGFSAIHLEGLLSDSFRVEHYSGAAEALESARLAPPDIVLMDVEMPEMDGYTACRTLKATAETREVPVIFLSAHGEAADRLAGYEAGGDDYVSKPFNPEELKRKVGAILRTHARSRDLAAHARAATDAAMAAMATAGDVGTVLNLLREIVSFTDLESIARSALVTMARYELEGAIQLRNGTDSCSLNHQGLCSPLEESVLRTMATCARIVDLGKRSAFNYERVSLIVNNMPRDDAERYGRLKDIVIMIAEAVEIHLRSLDLVSAARAREATLLDVARRLAEVDLRHQAHEQRSRGIVAQLSAEMEDAFLKLVLTERQEAHFQDLQRTLLAESEMLTEEQAETRAMSDEARRQLRLLQEEAATEPPSPRPTESGRAELF